MDATTLAAFRQGLYATFTRAGDALFEVADALLTAPQPRSFVELSQAPTMRRRWPSCYAALSDGRIDRAALRRLFARHLPLPAPGARLGLLRARRPAGPGQQLDLRAGQSPRPEHGDRDERRCGATGGAPGAAAV